MPTASEAITVRAAASAREIAKYGDPIPFELEVLENALKQPTARDAAHAFTDIFCTLASHCQAQPNHSQLSVAAVYRDSNDPEGRYALALPVTRPADIAEYAANALLSQLESANSCWKFDHFLAFKPHKVTDHEVGDEEFGWPSDLSRFTVGLRADKSPQAIQEAEAYAQLVAA